MDVQRGDPKLRAVALVVVVTALVAGVALLAGMQHWFAQLKHLPAAAAQTQLLSAFAWAFATVCASILWLAASLWRSGTRVCRAAQWPLPGSRVIRDTPILRGSTAARRGRLMQGAGVALLVCAVCIAVVAWRLYHAFAASAV
jgi:hypothetical protein